MTLEMRSARPGDREVVLDFCAQIWEGHDYLPRIWEDWLHDPAGPLLVALWDGRPVAVDKITLHSPHEAWLGGMRVDPACRGRGIAHALTGYCLRWLEARHVPVARYTTASDNEPIHRISAHFGFRRVAVVRRFVCPLQEGMPRAVPRVLTPDEEALAWNAMSGSAFLVSTAGLFGQGWTWWRFTRERLRAHIRRGEVLAWGEGRPLALAIVIPHTGPTFLRLEMLVGPREAGLAMLQALCCVPQLAPDDPEHPPHLRLTVPEGVPGLDWIVEQAGLEPRWDRAMWLFERDGSGGGR